MTPVEKQRKKERQLKRIEDKLEEILSLLNTVLEDKKKKKK